MYIFIYLRCPSDGLIDLWMAHGSLLAHAIKINGALVLMVSLTRIVDPKIERRNGCYGAIPDCLADAMKKLKVGAVIPKAAPAPKSKAGSAAAGAAPPAVPKAAVAKASGSSFGIDCHPHSTASNARRHCHVVPISYRHNVKQVSFIQ